MSDPAFPTWVANRILGFFNQAKSVEDITNGTIKDDPSDGPGRTIGATLAARILRERGQLPRRRFTEFEQLDNINGVGEGTIKDLVYTFGTNAAQAFQDAMYNGTIFRNNWTLEFFRTEFEDRTSFLTLANDMEKFRAWVVEKVKALGEERGASEKDIELMQDNLKNTYIDTYFNTTMAPDYALALWFYEFDADNWFGWEQIQKQTSGYFAHHSGYPWEMDLRFFKGFRQRGIIRPGITPDDLPVVVNWPEQVITIWVSALYD